eukprot:TRINITY_DN10541_c0_g1_i7.p1 TRINITY_DN10541_c0_g1~~TRINITY_DN10541_c0_g1_i7.p1  ORF type:complete len:542 (-),score=124.54 TRINITY_DN10541_c0_g1_i7:116-1690(-)
MEPEIASPKRSLNGETPQKEKPGPNTGNNKLNKNLGNPFNPNNPTGNSKPLNNPVNDFHVTSNLCHDIPVIVTPEDAKGTPQVQTTANPLSHNLGVTRTVTLQPGVPIVKSTSVGNMAVSEAKPKSGEPQVQKGPPGVQQELTVPSGLKRSSSEGNIQKKKEEEENLPPINWDGLFERLAPGDGNEQDYATINQYMEKKLSPAVSKVMELRAREYVARPHIRSYSRTLYNMAEIEKWISPVNPRNHLVLTHLLGQGAYGEVFCGRSIDPQDSQIYAIKVAVNLFDRPTKIHDITNEIRFLEECKHPNIVQHIKSFMWNKEIWTVMEFCDIGNLANMVEDVGLLSEEEACFITREVLKGVAYLHKCNKIHRDLKGDNILITSCAGIKIADFGLMTEASGENGRTSICGSRYWMSPEMLRAEGYGTLSDIWSVGSLVYEMITEGPPYIRFRSLKAIFYTATRGVDPLENSECYSSEFNFFLDCCFKVDPRRRFSAEQLLNTPWIKGCRITQEMFCQSLRHLWSDSP